MTFEDCFDRARQQAASPARVLEAEECRSRMGRLCQVCHAGVLTYDQEMAIKQAAWNVLWGTLRQKTRSQPIQPSPKGRGYRVVSKRRAYTHQNQVRLGLIDTARKKPFETLWCAVEPLPHARLYRDIQRLVNQPAVRPLAAVLQHVIIKGNYDEFTVILNVRQSDRAEDGARAISKALKGVAGFFLFEGSDEDYYMEARGSKEKALHRIYGKPEIFARHGGRPFLFSPVCFTQVNPGVADLMVAAAAEHLGLSSDTQLFDLYCGYGLFSLCLAERVRQVLGVEMSPESVRAAVENAHRQKVGNARFEARTLNGRTIARIVAGCRPQDVVLLDPPRSGPGDGVIEGLAQARPRQVCHIFCNVDRLGEDLARWQTVGYAPQRVVPLDMFPGSPSLEVMVFLARVE